MPPYELPDDKTQDGIKGHSSTDGSAENANEIRFEDKKGSEELPFYAEKNQHIQIEAVEVIHVGEDRTEQVCNNGSITVAVTRTVSVGINESINVGAAQQVTVGGR